MEYKRTLNMYGLKMEVVSMVAKSFKQWGGVEQIQCLGLVWSPHHCKLFATSNLDNLAIMMSYFGTLYL